MPFTVFLVDDDAGVLKALSRRLRHKGYDVLSFADPEEFLRQHDPRIPGCVVLDLSMPGFDGLQLQRVLTESGNQRPVVFISGKGDIPSTVRAIKGGAVDFLSKPIDDNALLDALARAKERDEADRKAKAELETIRSRLATLTPREREVLPHVVAGRLNKQIAGDLGTVEQTIKVHRRRMMEKLGVRTVLELARMMDRVDVTAEVTLEQDRRH
jgi:FixJ family two-component response regulator